MAEHDVLAPVTLPDTVKVVNVGLPLFSAAIAEQDQTALQVDWRIPGGGDAGVVDALRRLFGPLAKDIDEANAEVFRRLDRGAPQLVEVRTARDVVPGLAGKMLLHCGPRIELDDVSDPLRRSMRSAICAEGWADTPDEADQLLTTGTVTFEPANDHQTVVPMATVMGPQTPVWVVQLPDTDITTYAPLGQGSGDVAWFGKDSQGAIDTLILLRDVIGPVLEETIRDSGPVDILSLAAQAVAMGDDVHVRTQAATNLLFRTLLPALTTGSHPRKREAAEFLSANHLLFLSLAMAGARALTTWGAQVEGSSVITGLSRNGTTYSAWLGDGSRMRSTAPSPMIGRALYKPGQNGDNAAPDIGDSAVLELIGLGGAAAANSPAVAQLVGGTMAHAAELTEQLDRVCVGRSSRINLPMWGMRGSPLGVDVRYVVELGLPPQVTTGILDAHSGSGQIGAGVATAPIECFNELALALADDLTGP
jgi:hypothetical protein